jgi:hypothetical protein
MRETSWVIIRILTNGIISDAGWHDSTSTDDSEPLEGRAGPKVYPWASGRSGETGGERPPKMKPRHRAFWANGVHSKDNRLHCTVWLVWALYVLDPIFG